MKLVSNECVNCRRVIGYVTPEAFQIPTLCIICAGDKEVLKEWGHSIDKQEKPIKEVLKQYRFELNLMGTL